jgi:hypothetical protein
VRHVSEKACDDGQLAAPIERDRKRVKHGQRTGANGVLMSRHNAPKMEMG